MYVLQKWMYVIETNTHERNKIKRARLCMCSVFTQQTRTNTQTRRLKERQTITQTHSHSYKRTPIHNRRRITLNAFKIISFYFFYFILFSLLSSLCLLSSQLCCFDGLCLFHLLVHSLAPFICSDWCLTKFEIWLFLRFLTVVLILIYLYPHISYVVCIR